MLQTIHSAFHRPQTAIYRRTEAVIWVLVVASILLLVVEPFVPPALERTFVWADRIILALFAVELFLRVASYRPPALDVFERPPLGLLRTHLLARLRFLLRPMTLVDLITVLAVLPQLRGLRALRFLRLLRTWNVFRYGNPFAGLMRAFEHDRVLWAFAFSVLAVETIAGGVTLYLLERSADGGVTSIGDGMYWALVTLTTVGYGDVTPVTPLGRMVASALMVGGMFTLALFAGIVGHSLLNAVLSIREEQFRMSSYVNHIVVCGYEEGSSLFLEALDDELDLGERRVVLFAPGQRPPDVPPDILWVDGDPTKESELDKVRLTHAEAVLVIARRSVLPSEADAISLLTIFTIRSYLGKQPAAKQRKRPVHIVAEILDSENIGHASAAGADEVIESRRLGFAMLAHSLLYHGVGNLTAKVVASGSMNLYVGSVPAEISADRFGDVAQQVRRLNGALVIGLLDDLGEHINPSDETPVRPGARLVYLAERPLLEVT